MKKFFAAACAFVCISVVSCRHNHHDVQLTYTDADHEYSMVADFNNKKMREVEYYLNRELGAQSKVSFANMRTDATFTLDDRTRFYLRKEPGHIKIVLDKDENSKAAYHRMKSVCEGMKRVITQ